MTEVFSFFNNGQSIPLMLCEQLHLNKRALFFNKHLQQSGAIVEQKLQG
ncbi:hypothetical protein [Bacillus wiedmannii]|nr:hypothetical protein [Bacillus wiedmannii]